MPSTHHQFLEAMLHDPRLIGIDSSYSDLSITMCEYEFRDKARVVTEVDLVLRAESGLYVVEYKSYDRPKQRQKAKQQLLLARDELRARYGLRVDHLLYVHDWFVTEELVDGWMPCLQNQDYLASVDLLLHQGKRTGNKT